MNIYRAPLNIHKNDDAQQSLVLTCHMSRQPNKSSEYLWVETRTGPPL